MWVYFHFIQGCYAPGVSFTVSMLEPQLSAFILARHAQVPLHHLGSLYYTDPHAPRVQLA